MAPVEREPDEGDEVEEAARCLARGGVVAFPTETVYGLGASARLPAAVRRVFAIKGRPATRALTVHVHGPEALPEWGRDVAPWVVALVERVWPGPLTVIVARPAWLDTIVTGGGDTVGLRAPDHPLARALLRSLAREEGELAGIAAPSANRFGHTPPTSAAQVRASLGDLGDLAEGVDHVLDGGDCRLGIESTVLDTCGPRPRIVRPGAVSRERLRELTGREIEVTSALEGTAATEEVDSAAQRLIPFPAGESGSLRPTAGAGVIARAAAPADLAAGVRWLALPADDTDYARALYPALRELELAGAHPIHVERAREDEALGPAINARVDRRSRS